MNRLLQELRWRGFVSDTTPQLSAHLDQGPTLVYCGFDPTAPSFQVGNLVPLMLLAHFQRAGHRPIVLMGGGTGLIGDPSGKRSERPLLSREQIGEHLRRMRDQTAGFLDFDPGPTQALVLDNAKWLDAAKLIDFLRDVGKHFTVNVMLQKESVKARLEAGISYTEFSYMLLQAYDFLHLFRTQRCTIQVGGSDQWGNITAGVELIRRVADGEAHGLVHPLMTTATGAKFGKSDSGAIYLDPALTSPYRFYQFWMNVDDRDAADYLKLFTTGSKDEIESLAARAKKDPAAREAQRALAKDVTARVHGAPVAASVESASQLLFGDFDPRSADAAALEVLSREIPTVRQPAGTRLADAVVAAGLAKSKSEARRAIEQGGIYVNQQRVTDGKKTIDGADLLAGGYVLLRKGRKDYALINASA
ncbi:MAG: tyrosine--tRNA ligase [Gemmatimonadales bacterium]